MEELPLQNGFLYISGFSGETGRPRFFHIIPLQNGPLYFWRFSFFQVAILLKCLPMPGSPLCRGQCFEMWKGRIKKHRTGVTGRKFSSVRVLTVFHRWLGQFVLWCLVSLFLNMSTCSSFQLALSCSMMSPDLNVKALHSFSLRVGMSNQTQTGTSKRQHRNLSPELQSFSNSQTWLGRGGISWNCLSVNTLCKINFWCSVQSCLWSSVDSLQRKCVEPRVLIFLSLAVSLRVHCWMQTCAWDFWDVER